MAKEILEARGHTQVLNAGGPSKPDLWAVLSEPHDDE